MTSVGQTRALRGRRAMRPSGDDREQAILATAERLLEQRSFADISVDDLAKGAGLSRPTFYFYFKSKDAVLLSLLEPVIARADSEFDGAVQRLPADPRRVWRNGIKAFFTAFSTHRRLARAATEALATSSELRVVWLGFMQKWIDQTAAIITAERTRGAAPETIPAVDLATSLNQMNERTMMAALSAETPAVDEDRVVDTLTHIWVTSIYGESG
ncbi:TetR family transcriptional regulator [Mycobacterium sp. 852002-53434_SCH5985345]|uniref:TetR/AcrR family transcriptional regulator n=1 Tax=unclassified Mycobacterium TaxID=2642494 RepID=UPI0007FD5D8A|nr:MULTISPECIES: TetR/AcrR family transcriptional regulator [unclassified Mycobacterium]OBF54282.1 TetR family transcriptional regulator [Mycobacterium sp. 852002-53434_SCH5985345]OBF74298.1 TetR family transcriptional regulator [Mycobacterium sp. 852002-51613_SCH5001154]OBF91694.1 TetR family transcriptional regulator [Mycobacterium sp. 852014-52450_SCH5900713]